MCQIYSLYAETNQKIKIKIVKWIFFFYRSLIALFLFNQRQPSIRLSLYNLYPFNTVYNCFDFEDIIRDNLNLKS